jgi:hypothetical protein
MVRGLSGRLLALLVVMAVAGLAAGCDDETPTTPTTPTVPVTVTFTGQVTQSGSATHNFSTTTSGAVSATLKAIGTDNTLVVSFALGTWTGSACSVVLANDAATGGAVLSGTMTGAGTLCARVGDVGNIAAGQTATYTIEVTHPS